MLNIINLIVKYNRKDEEKLREIEELFINEKKNDMKRERNYGFSMGQKQGFSKGIENVARNLLKQNIDINVIMNATKLSKNKILSLKQIN